MPRSDAGFPFYQRLKDRAAARALDAAAALMDGVSLAVRRLPARARYLPADAITVPLAALWVRPGPGPFRRPVIARNVALLLGLPEAHPRAGRLARASVRNFGRMAIDFLLVRTMSPAEVLAWVRPVNAHYLEEALRARRGVIFVLPHAGSWDVAAAFAQAYGCQLTVVTENNWATQLVAGSRRGHGVTLAPRPRRGAPRRGVARRGLDAGGGGASLRPLFRALARNEAVVMLSDIARSDVQSVAVPFRGRPALFPLGPARLSQRTGAPILVIGCMRRPDGSYRIEAQAPLYADPALAPADAAVALTAAIAVGFERIITRDPAQWYPFHPIWTGDA